jgi:type IV pilus assembly protein PilA
MTNLPQFAAFAPWPPNQVFSGAFPSCRRGSRRLKCASPAIRRSTRSETAMNFTLKKHAAGQGMTEYIIIVALIAIAAIGVYSAFGDIVRGQTSVAAAALSGDDSGNGRGLVGNAQGRANASARQKTLENFEEQQ